MALITSQNNSKQLDAAHLESPTSENNDIQ